MNLDDAAPRPKVLIVDDVDANLIALEALLADMDCIPVRARTGNDALRQLLKNEFAIVLLDVQMPDMDGYEVAQHARQNPSTREVPIIFLTAAQSSEDKALQGYGSGAVDFLFKPINPTVLRSKVRVFLELYRSRRQIAELSERRVAEERIRAAELEAENRRVSQASQLKSKFLANMSHELRTPLNSIIGFAQILIDGEVGTLESQQMEFVEHILISGTHLLRLINDVLDLSKVEAGKMEFHPEPTDPAKLVAEVVGILRETAQNKPVRLSTRVEAGLNDLVVDPGRLKQVLYNYVSNAIKFTPEGGTVDVRVAAEGQECFRIEVRDSGVGIAPGDLDRLFVEFEQLDAGSAKRHGGTGLGLALTRRLVEAQGGTVGAQSELGLGSVFHAVLPRRVNGT